MNRPRTPAGAERLFHPSRAWNRAPLLSVLIALALLTPATSIIAQSKDAAPERGDARTAPHTRFQEAWHLEIAEGKPREALALYEGLVAAEELPASLRAKALFRSALCRRKLGEEEAARDALERVLTEFAAVLDVAAEARRELDGAWRGDAIVRRAVEEKFGLLWTAPRSAGGSQRSEFEDILASLEAMGPRAAAGIVEAVTAAEPHPARAYLAAILVRFAREDADVARAVESLLASDRKALVVELLDAARLSPRPGSFETLRGLTADRDPKVRAAAARALGPDESSASRATLRGLLDDPEPGVREAALQALGESAELDDLAAVRARTADPVAEVSAAAILATRRILLRAGMDSPELDAEADSISRAPAGAVLDALVALFGAFPASLDTEGVDALAARLDEVTSERSVFFPSDRPGETRTAPARLQTSREIAIELLLTRREPSIVPVLISILETRGSHVAPALEAAEAIGDPRVIPSLVGLLEGREERTPRGPSRTAQEGRIAERAWELLTRRFWTPLTRGLLAERFEMLEENIQAAAAERLLGSGDAGIAAKVFASYSRLERKARLAILQHPAVRRPENEGAAGVIANAVLDGESREIRREALGLARQVHASPALAEPIVRSFEDSMARGWEDTAVLALQALGRIASPRGRAVMLAALGSDREKVASEASTAFRRDWAGVETTRELIQLAQGRESFFPVHAAKTLARLATPSHIPALGEALEGTPVEGRRALVDALARFGDPAAIGALRSLLATLGQEERKDHETIARVVEVIARIGGPEALDVLVEFAVEKSSRGSEVRKALKGFPDDLLRGSPRLLDRLTQWLEESESHWESLQAAELLARLGNSAAIEVLTDALGAEASSIGRTAALQVLAALKNRRAAPALLAVLESEADPYRARLAVEGLSGIDAPGVLAALTRRLAASHDERGSQPEDKASREARQQLVDAILLALQRLEPAPVFDALRPLLERGVEPRTKLLELLVSLDDPRSKDLVLEYLDQDDVELRRIAAREAGSLLGVRDIARLVDRLRDSDAQVRTLARESIESIRFYESAKRLAEDASDASRELRGLLEHVSAAVRAAAVGALARSGERDALESILRLRKDPDASVREAVEAAIESLTAKP